MGIFISDDDNGMGLSLIVPKTAFEEIEGGNKVDNKTIYMYAEEKAERETIRRVETLLEGNEDVQIMSTEDVRAEVQFVIALLTVVGNGLSLVFVFLGIMNFINLISAGIQARRNEISILESIGMTRKQVIAMLIKEGMGYSVISMGIMFTAGLAFTIFVVKTLSRVVEYAVFTFPFLPVTVVCITVIVSCILIPIFMYHNITKEQLTERIWYE